MGLIRSLIISLIILPFAGCNVKVERNTEEKAETPSIKTSVKLTQDARLNSSFEEVAKQTRLESSKRVRLDSIIYFTWDTLIIVPPMASVERIELETGRDLSSAKAAGKYQQEFNILMFYEKGQLIKCLKLPVSIVELGGYHNSMFSVNSCLFEFVRTDYNLTEYGEPVVEGRIAK